MEAQQTRRRGTLGRSEASVPSSVRPRATTSAGKTRSSNSDCAELVLNKLAVGCWGLCLAGRPAWVPRTGPAFAILVSGAECRRFTTRSRKEKISGLIGTAAYGTSSDSLSGSFLRANQVGATNIGIACMPQQRIKLVVAKTYKGQQTCNYSCRANLTTIRVTL